MRQTATLLHLATKQQLQSATALLGAAFQQDPANIYIYPNEEERRRWLPVLFGVAVRYAWRYGELTGAQDAERITGVSCWLPPDQPMPAIGRLLRSGVLRAALQPNWRALLRSNRTESYANDAHRRYASQPHWYLWALAVAPAVQGRGIGSALLRSGLERADTTGIPCYLETTNPANVPLYRRFGFIVVNEGDIPDTGVRSWSMLRPRQ